MAVVLDRLTQAIGNPPKDGLTWQERGPVGATRNALAGRKAPAEVQ